ncbi:MAG: hypothetical protein AAGA73_05920, partial [Pseudomonadota bacterium]
PFDWRRLDVATDLTIQPAEWNGTLTFINSGTGPILNLAATLTGDDKRPFEPFKPEGLLTHKWLVSLTPKGGTYIGPFPDISDAHVETLYRTIDPKESTTSRGPFVDCRPIEPVDHRCNGVVRALYEEVTSVTRLMELTDLKRVSSIDIDYRLSIIDYRFEDLKGHLSSGQQTIALPQQLYWYRKSPQLLDRLPMIDDPSTSLAYDEGSGGEWSSDEESIGFGPVDVVGLAKQLFGVAVEGPKGVGLITTELDIDLEDLPECSFAKAIAEPRTLLQGSGLVSISVNLNKPRNGRYLLRFLLNGRDRHALSINFLVPDRLRFGSDVQTSQFTNYDAGPPPVCGDDR